MINYYFLSSQQINKGNVEELENVEKNILGTQWHSWLRHCSKTWKFMGSMHDIVIGIFN
jgi:hypothetical protein